MSVNPFIFDMRRLKFDCIQAYFHFQLENAEKQSKESTSKVCTRNYEEVRNNLLGIKEIIEKNGNTYEKMEQQLKRTPFLAAYYNVTGEIVKKYFNQKIILKREDYPTLTDEEFEEEQDKYKKGWIPSFLALEVFRQFTEKGYKDFKEVDFLALQGEYEAFKDKGKGVLAEHYACAEEIVKSIENKKVFKRKK